MATIMIRKALTSLFFRKMVIPHILLLICLSLQAQTSIDLKTEQITSGDKHHFFGYIGQCQTIPWNASARYILGLEVNAIDRMPYPDEAADIILIDTRNGNKILYLDRTRAWNPQQGTMFYWNPLAPETQFFFNDKDTSSGAVFTVLYDIQRQKRIQEYRYDDAPIGNGGVAADGLAWLGLNYGRLARLRPVTGYPGAVDWSAGHPAPEYDGLFHVDLLTGKKRLLVSYHQLDEHLKKRYPDLTHSGLFINHTLWNRDASMVYFFMRGNWGDRPGQEINVPCSINADGTGLTLHATHIGGHPEWDTGHVLIGRKQGEREAKSTQILYDVINKEIIGQLGTPEMFPRPGGDIALSPDGDWFVNGYTESGKNYYAIFRRSDEAFVRSEGFDKGSYRGNIRIDPAPRWNRTNDSILVPGIDQNGTRQMFVIRIITQNVTSEE